MGSRAITVVIVLLCAAVAHADEEKPWAVGVSEEEQQKALAKFQEGNESFIKDEWRKALDAYTEALTYWDHPNIRYNAAVCLIKLDRSVEAYEHMQAALKYGEAPLGTDLFKQGKTYLEMLAKMTSYIEIICKQPTGVQVTLDGEKLDKCPETKLVAPGKHQIVSEKPGYKTERREVVAPPGGRETVVIVMQVEGTRKLVRRWPKWVPWTVVGVGTAFSVVALPLFVTTQNRFDRYETDLANACTGGCAPDDPRYGELAGDLDTARTYRTLTISSIALGAAGVGVGIALIVMNQPRYARAPTVTPMVGADRAGVSFAMEW